MIDGKDRSGRGQGNNRYQQKKQKSSVGWWGRGGRRGGDTLTAIANPGGGKFEEPNALRTTMRREGKRREAASKGAR